MFENNLLDFVQKDVYNAILIKVNNVYQNLNNAIDNLTVANNKLENAIKINGNVLDKENINAIKDDLLVKKEKMAIEIIPELRNKVN